MKTVLSYDYKNKKIIADNLQNIINNRYIDISDEEYERINTAIESYRTALQNVRLSYLGSLTYVGDDIDPKIMERIEQIENNIMSLNDSISYLAYIGSQSSGSDIPELDPQIMQRIENIESYIGYLGEAISYLGNDEKISYIGEEQLDPQLLHRILQLEADVRALKQNVFYVEEDGLYFTDDEGNIAAKLDPNGFHTIGEARDLTITDY